jgi:hydroxyacylglutathione hydrolase
MELTALLVRGIVVGLFQENCYIVGSRRTGEAICVDPGDEPDQIMALARDMGVRVTKIVCSHAHLDHIMAARAIKERTGAPFLLHPADLDIARNVPTAARTWLGTDVLPPPEPDYLLADGDDLEVPGVSLKLIHTPGHTQGSVSIYGGGMLFSGDTLFRGSIGRTDLPGGNFPQIIQTITTRLLTLPDDTIVLPGHMQETTIGAERVTNPFLRPDSTA